MSTAWERPSKRCSLASRRSAGMIRMARKAEDDTTTEVAEAPGLELADFHNIRKSLLASVQAGEASMPNWHVAGAR
jgi:hypothetical protein